ncbi:MAG: CAP domain-containing protein [Planctomycetota bacterium]|nr:CAP domain-containing protein [Planctomycetota bacterium]
MSLASWMNSIFANSRETDRLRSRREVSKLGFESLEERRLMSATPIDAPISQFATADHEVQATFEISGADQYLVELINRSRTNPYAEAARNGIDLDDGLLPGTLDGAPVQALAPNQALRNAALGHSNDMIDREYFSHVNPESLGPVERIQRAGYSGLRNFGENLAWVGSSATTDLSAAVEQTHANLFRSAGHRRTLLSDAFREVGVGVAEGDFQGLNSVVSTELFARRLGDSFLTGVVYEDTVVDNDFYSIGEAFAGGSIVATNMHGEAFETTVGSSGGYTLQLPDGSYNVVLTDSRLSNQVVGTAMINGSNAKVDFEVSDLRISPDPNPGPIAPNPGSTATESLSLILAGTSVTEGDETTATTGVVTRTGDLSQELIVQIASTDSTEVNVPQSIVIAAGEAQSSAFDVTAVNDTVIDGTQHVTLFASANGFNAGQAALDVLDNETTMQLLSPSGEILDSTPVFEWNEMPDAARYVLIVDSEDQPGVIRELRLTEAKFAAANELAAGEYVARVIALAADGHTITEADPVVFQVAAPPTIKSPAQQTNDAVPVFEWSVVDAATKYELRVDDLNRGQANVIHETELDGTSFEAADPLASGRYRMSVRAIDANGQPGAWSESRVFELIASPALDQITGPILEAFPTFSWSGIVDAERYELAVVAKLDGQVVAHEANLTETSFTLGTQLPTGQYDIWVRAYDANGATPWGDPMTFQTAIPPRLALPHGGGEIEQTPTIRWEAPAGFASYEVQVDDLTTGQSKVLTTADATKSLTLTDPLPGGRHRFLVRGILENGQAGVWSDPAFVTVNDPTVYAIKPTVLGPSGDIDESSPTFTWSPIRGAAGYQISIRDVNEDVETTSGVIRSSGLETQAYQLKSEMPPGVYEVRIRAFDSRLETSDWSETVSFSIGGAVVEPVAVDPVAAALDQLLTFEFDGHGLI